MRNESAFDVDDDLSLVKFLACQKRGANVFPCVEMPVVFDVVDTACDDAHLMHVMDTMDDAFTMHALSTHVEEMNEEAPFLSTFASTCNYACCRVSGAPHRGISEVDLQSMSFHDAFENAKRNHARTIHDANGNVESSHARGKGYKLFKKRGKVKNPLVKKGQKSNMHEAYDFVMSMDLWKKKANARTSFWRPK
ncbi:hypothetical protein GOP47_0030910, partial [Adiantum capillus-veneris]